MKHPLVILANAINWEAIENKIAPLFCSNNGRPASPETRIAQSQARTWNFIYEGIQPEYATAKAVTHDGYNYVVTPRVGTEKDSATMQWYNLGFLIAQRNKRTYALKLNDNLKKCLE